MSKFIDIISATTTTLVAASDYPSNSPTNRRASSKANISKISITNYSTHANGASIKVFLYGLEATRTVNQSNGTVTNIIFDQENYTSDADRIEVGDTVYDSDGTLHGTITALNPDNDNTKEITISSSTAITDNETFKISKVDNYITGTINIPAGVTLVLDDSFSFNLFDYELRIDNSGSSTPRLTVRID